MQPFRDVLDECSFMDMGHIGPQFTWHKHYARYTIWERLDRVVATNEWFDKFPDTKVYHLDVTTFDHKPLWVVLEIMECCQHRPFRFEQMWMTESGCSDTIEAVWRSGEVDPRSVKLLNKVDRCGIELTKWSKKIFGSVRAELEKKLLQQAERRAIQGGNTVWMRTLEREINGLMDKEAKMWAQ
ncbi:uncharacterized protein LOC142605862 [Castanea sativa]|uniref:uncharacterized protein LOC142605862 n=1 Tax=Castanea sativa TaxID=21020 RepID=UPI003F64B862